MHIMISASRCLDFFTDGNAVTLLFCTGGCVPGEVRVDPSVQGDLSRTTRSARDGREHRRGSVMAEPLRRDCLRAVLEKDVVVPIHDGFALRF